MHKLQQVIYTGTATATGGREGTATSSDGNLSVTLSTPKALGEQEERAQTQNKCSQLATLRASSAH